MKHIILSLLLTIIEEAFVVVEVVDHNRSLAEDYAFVRVVVDNIVVVVLIQVKDHKMDFVGNRMLEMGVHLDSIQQLHHHIHNEHHWDTFVVVVDAEDHAFVVLIAVVVT